MASIPTGKPNGRPSDYTPELASKICALISTHPIGLKKICDKYDDIPSHQTIKTWRREKPEFHAQYLIAKEEQALSYVEELSDYIDDVDERSEAIAKAMLRFRYYQWQLSKLAPKQFGEKKEQVVNVSVHESDLKHLK